MILTLDAELETIVRQQLEHGPYQTALDVVRAALHQFEEREQKLAHLRKIVAAGDAQFERGEYEEWTPELRDRLRREAKELARQGHQPHPDVVP